ncbi:MAG TPA: hypothetical protein VFU22_08180, partial [Roseiflexaceae bacterium]|nr:hypothetical protein [Roseiflexaceae bacterium]
MIMPLGIRKLVLTAHVTFSVGWPGAVVVFLALAVVGLTSQDAQTVRGAYLVILSRRTLHALAHSHWLRGAYAVLLHTI